MSCIVQGQPPKKPVEDEARVKKNRKRGKRRKGGHNLSTDVNLEAPSAPTAPGRAPSQSQECSSSLKVYPDGIQRFV